jgi:flagellar basal-body rod modification protein FlgD
MAINSDYSVSSAFNTYGTEGKNIGEDKSILDKDDFLQLLLVELQNQDPTNPADSDKILQQTSDLATLESSKNTNESLSKLSESMSQSTQFSTIGAIGKMADTGRTGINLESGNPVNFDLYFQDAMQSGQIQIKNDQGIVVETINLDANSEGTQTFYWDGKNDQGTPYADGKYTIEANYTATDGTSKVAKYGVYPIESVRFENGVAEIKLGNKYVPVTSIKEIYNS